MPEVERWTMVDSELSEEAKERMKQTRELLIELGILDEDGTVHEEKIK